MDILYIVTQADGGGAQQYTLQLAKHFKGGIAAGTEHSKLFADAAKLGLATYPLKHLKRNIRPLSDFLALIEIILLVQRLRPDIVHLNSSKAGFLGSLIKPFVKAKIVFTAHGFVFNEPFPYFKRLFYFALEKFASFFRDSIITISETERRSALKNRLISEEKITTVHNGIPPLVFLAKDEARSQLKLPEHLFIFGAVANFYKTKGLEIFVQAVSQLPNEIKEKSLFTVLGDGPERRNLEFRIRNYGLQDTFLLLGKIPNAKIFLKAFDVFVMPSRKEGFSYALLEAMQAGLPIAATDVGGNREALGEAGIIVKPENPDLLAKALHGLFINPQTRQLLAEKALRQSQLFTETRMLEKTEQLYKKLLHQK